MMLKKVQKKIEQLHMVSAGDVVLVGVSGGADSVSLFCVLNELSHTMNFVLEAVHVEHGIRGEESKKDAAFVEKLCREKGVFCHIVSVDVPGYCKETGLGTEEAARILRYQVFAQIAKEKQAKIALAHHMEDNAETILFQMVRGSSLTGLCGMQPIRKDENGVCYIRPFLSVHRSEIEDYLKEIGQNYCIDSTNLKLDYSRNYLRNVVIPELVQVNAQAVSHMNATAEHLLEVKEFMEQETQKAWEKVASIIKDDILLDTKKLLGLHKALQKEIAYKAIAQMSGGKKDISSTHVTDLLALCQNQSGKELMLPKGVVAKKEYETVHLYVLEKKDPIPGEESILEISEETLAECVQRSEPITFSIGNGKETLTIQALQLGDSEVEIPQKIYTKWFDYDKIKKGFCIRTRQSGDYFISDAKGHRKKIKQYLIDEKIPLAKRDKMWLLAQDQLVFWIIGGRISEHAKVVEKTNTIIEITYDGGH